MTKKEAIEVDDPDVTDPDSTDQDATDQDSTDPDATDQDTTDPDSTDQDSTDQDATDQSDDSGDPEAFDVDGGTGDDAGYDADSLQDAGTYDQGTDQGSDDSGYGAYAGGDDGASDALGATNDYPGPTRIPMKDAEHEAQVIQKVLQPVGDGIAGVVNLASGLEGHAIAGVASLLGYDETAQRMHGVASRAIDDAAAAGRNVLRDIGSPHVDGDRESMWNP